MHRRILWRPNGQSNVPIDSRLYGSHFGRIRSERNHLPTIVGSLESYAWSDEEQNELSIPCRGMVRERRTTRRRGSFRERIGKATRTEGDFGHRTGHTIFSRRRISSKFHYQATMVMQDLSSCVHRQRNFFLSASGERTEGKGTSARPEGREADQSSVDLKWYFRAHFSPLPFYALRHDAGINLAKRISNKRRKKEK